MPRLRRPRPTLSRGETLLHQIPEGDRAIFERYYGRRLEEALRAAEAEAANTVAGAADHDAVEATLLQTLIAETEGRHDPEGLGFVPHREQGYELVPPAHDPRLTPGPTPRMGNPASMTPGRWIAVAAALLLGGTFLTWSLWPANDPVRPVADAARTGVPTPGLSTVTAQPPTPTPLLEEPTSMPDTGLKVEATTPTSLEIAGTDGTLTVLRVVPSRSTLGGTWQPEVAPGTAAWLAGTSVNTVLCLPLTAQPLLEATTRGRVLTLRTAAGTLRTYSVLRTRSVGRQQTEVLDQRRAGLTMVLCGASMPDANRRTVVEAVPRPVEGATPRGDEPAARGTAVGLADLARVEVAAARVLTPTADLPPGMADVAVEVVVENLQATLLSMRELADQLEIGGQIAEATTPADAGPALLTPLSGHERRHVVYTYRVPASGGQAIWRLLAPTGEAAVVRVVLPAAERPRTTLDVQLEARGVSLHSGTDGQRQLRLALDVTNPATIALPLDTVTVLDDGGRVLPLISPLPTAVPPGAAQTIVLATEAPAGKVVIVRYGAKRWQVQLP